MWDGHTGRFMSKSRYPFPILISKLAMHQSLLSLDLGGGWLESWCRFVFLFSQPKIANNVFKIFKHVLWKYTINLII